MFGKIASEALGLSDIGRVISPENYNKVEADDYIKHETGEKIFFLIKSKTDEYCFTNFALLHLDGNTALSKKRLLKRYEYINADIRNVLLETAGTIDLDVELKFRIHSTDFSIDVHKEHIEQLKDIYKALTEISLLMEAEQRHLQTVEKSLSHVVNSLARQGGEGTNIATQARELYAFYHDTLSDAMSQAYRKDYSSVFETFIKN
jgi:hypothetical protein